jgi:TusA-related sulfurtransferase
MPLFKDVDEAPPQGATASELAASAAESFLRSLAGRDFEGLEGCLAPTAQARLLLPKRTEELAGSAEITSRLEGWFGSASEFHVIACQRDGIGPRERLSWRFRLVRDGRSWEIIEQVAFVDVGPDGIRRMDLLCSGFHPDAPETAESPDTANTANTANGRVAHMFDAGSMGCADGLAQEFRRQISSIAVGCSLVTVVRDPAAREDLPPLARMLGHTVTSVEDRDDGAVSVTVERRR